MEACLARQFQALHRLVGNTPLLEISLLVGGKPRTIFAKHESLNLTGSIKDRMALYILEHAYRDGTIKPGDRIVEATSGNTGIAFAAIGRALHHPVTVFMPDWMSGERKALIASFGAEIMPVTHEQGGFLGSIRLAEGFYESYPGVFLPRQFENQANVQAHAETTGPEIWMQLRSAGLTPHAFVAGVGTGGTVMGTGNYLRSKRPAIKVHAIEPAESPTLTTGHKAGSHRIQGISDEFIPPIVELAVLDPVISVNDGDAILMAQQLAHMGLAVGISSGANLLGALKAQQQLGRDAIVVTVFPDSNKKYLSTDLLRQEPVKDGYLSPDVEVTGFQTFRRVCAICA